MSALLQGVPRRTGGRIEITNGATIPHHFHNGLPYELNGDLAIDGGGIVHHYHQGLPFTLEGRLIMEATPVDHFGSGAAPFNAANRLVRVVGAGTIYSSGVQYNAAQAVTTI